MSNLVNFWKKNTDKAGKNILIQKCFPSTLFEEERKMSIQMKYGVPIWKEIKKNAAKYAQKEEVILPETRASDLFYVNTEEGRNRYGQVLFDTFDYVHQLTGKELKIDYKPRTEFEKFKELQDVWIYFINKLEDLGERTSEEDNVIQFTR